VRNLFLAFALLLTGSVPVLAAEHTPTPVYVRQSCDGPVGSTAVTSLLKKLRESPSYDPDVPLFGGNKDRVQPMISVICSESSHADGVQMAAVAYVFGTSTCHPDNTCVFDPDEGSLGVFLVGEEKGPWAGNALYETFDKYMAYIGSRILEIRAVRALSN
jgi:hypothetical protein